MVQERSNKEKEMSLNVLLISDTMFKERTAAHGNIDPKLIYPDIKFAQDKYIHPLLGSALFNKMLTLVSSGNISGVPNADYKNLLDNYIVDALVYYTMATLPMGLSYQFWNKGVMRKQGTDTELPSMTDLVSIADNYMDRAEWYGERLRRYLQATHTTTVLPEYGDPGSTTETIHPEHTAFTMPIYLGDGCGCRGSLDSNNCRYEENC